MDIRGSGGFDVAAHANIHDRRLGFTQRDDAGRGCSSDGDGRCHQQWLIHAAAPYYMLNGLHRLTGTDGHTIDIECDPRLERIRGQRVVEAGDAVEVVVRLLYILAMKA